MTLKRVKTALVWVLRGKKREASKIMLPQAFLIGQGAIILTKMLLLTRGEEHIFFVARGDSCQPLKKHKHGFNPDVMLSHYNVRTEGSREIIRTVLSTSPTARNRERCSPGGTLARLIQTTSADISFRSVYSFSWPDYRTRDKDYGR